MRIKAPTGVCKSASTERTTGTTFPCRASRSNASKDDGCRSSIYKAIHRFRRFFLPQTSAGEPVAAVDNQHNAINETRCLGTDKYRGFLDIGNSAKASE